MMPKTDVTKFKYELDSEFNIIIKTKIEIRITIIFIETNNNIFE
tara:strand:+ start:315 stop:446 length:132 start_codon:yes stop_codon:yes gene_type:complete